MKLIRFATGRDTPPTVPPGTTGVHWGVMEDDEIYVIDGSPYGKHHVKGKARTLKQVRLLPPCFPSKIVCVGRNYSEHARELAHDIPDHPLIFFKPPSALLAHGDTIVYPPDVKRLDYEGEIAIVIKERLRHLKAHEPAAPYILGFTCLNDVTGRDLQDKDGQWTRAKGFDTFCSIGPLIDTVVDPARLEVRTTLNGELKQQGHVSQMLFDFDTVLRFISRVMTLEPGDVVATGTPAGVGPMKIGDTVEVSISGVGTLRNVVGKDGNAP